jgi:hypothetical protein
VVPCVYFRIPAEAASCTLTGAVVAFGLENVRRGIRSSGLEVWLPKAGIDDLGRITGAENAERWPAVKALGGRRVNRMRDIQDRLLKRPIRAMEQGKRALLLPSLTGHSLLAHSHGAKHPCAQHPFPPGVSEGRRSLAMTCHCLLAKACLYSAIYISARNCFITCSLTAFFGHLYPVQSSN